MSPHGEYRSAQREATPGSTSHQAAAAPPPAFDLPRRRALGLGGAMIATAALAWAMRPVADPQRQLGQPLAELVPRQLGPWLVDPNAEALVRAPTQGGKAYGLYDQVLERVYHAEGRPSMMLSIAYGAEQSAGMQAHRPEVCYPSAGYIVEQLQRTELQVAALALPATQLHARMGPRSEPVTYWIVLGDEVVRDALAFRLRQVAFGLRRRVLDGLLVRISSIDEDARRAWLAQQGFAQALHAALEPTQRPRVFGAAARPAG